MVMQSADFYSIFCLFQPKYPRVKLRQARMHAGILREAHIARTQTHTPASTHAYLYTAVKPSFLLLSILPLPDCLIETCFLSCQPLLRGDGEVFVRESWEEGEKHKRGERKEREKRRRRETHACRLRW